MTLTKLLWSACLSAGMVTYAVPLSAAVSRPAPSSTSSSRQEANNMFSLVEFDAARVAYHADKISGFSFDPQITWQAHVDQLNRLRREINDMGSLAYRLETMRGTLAPWQQKTVTRIEVGVRLLVDNAQDAIVFENANHQVLWSPVYQRYIANLFRQAKSLTNSVQTAVKYARVSEQYQGLKHNLGVRNSS